MASTLRQEVSTDRVNPLAVVSLVVAGLAIAGMLGLGIGALAAFAVGAGHVFLHQIRSRPERGRLLAIIGLIVGYGSALWSLVSGLRYIPIVFAEIF